jgi:hypothetical protein
VCCLQAVQKWCLLVLSALLSDDTFRQWALPWGTALQPLQAGTAETLDTLEGLVVLLAAGISRCVPCCRRQQTCPAPAVLAGAAALACRGITVQTHQLHLLHAADWFCTPHTWWLGWLVCFAL